MNKLNTPKEVADLIRCKVRTVYHLIRVGSLKALRINRQLRVMDEDITSFLEEQKERGTRL
jgi:excisionase family DNA binding protein